MVHAMIFALLFIVFLRGEKTSSLVECPLHANCRLHSLTFALDGCATLTCSIEDLIGTNFWIGDKNFGAGSLLELLDNLLEFDALRSIDAGDDEELFVFFKFS